MFYVASSRNGQVVSGGFKTQEEAQKELDKKFPYEVQYHIVQRD